MSAKDQMTKMLDQLMGQNRDGYDKGREKTFLDKDVCRPFILGICINELFVNTRAELPDCSKLHSLGLRVKFEEASKTRDHHFEEEVHDYLAGFIRENERKIEHAKARLHHTQEAPENEEKVSKLDKIHELAVQIGEQVAKAEDLGAQGNVDESLVMMGKVEEIKAQKKALEDEYHSSIPRHAVQQQKLRACEVCGAFLSMYDNDRRLADHFGGKLHIGFVTIREKMKQLEDIIKLKEEKKLKEREEYQKDRENRKRSRSREKDRDREHGRGSHDSSRDRDSDRSREKNRDRSRERDRDRRSRSRDRGRRRDRDDHRRRSRADSREREYRDRDRDRDRGRERSRRERSRSRERNGRHKDRSKSR